MVNKLMIHFGELYTKGKNRRDFIRRLRDNIGETLRAFKVQIETKHDHIYISKFKDSDLSIIVKRLQNTSGIHAISEVNVFNRDLELVKKYAKELILSEGYQTFKIITKRKDKTYPLLSDAVNREVATYVIILVQVKNK